MSPDELAAQHGDRVDPAMTEKYGGQKREQRGHTLTCRYVAAGMHTVVYHHSATGTDGNRMFFDHWKSLTEIK